MLQAGVNATVTALYGVADQAPQVTAAQLAVGAIVTPAPDADLRVSARSAVQVRQHRAGYRQSLLLCD